MGQPVYLDHAATTYVIPDVLAAMLPYYQQHWGNPSSVYSLGREARRALDSARDTVADVLGCRANEVVFTGGGSESDNLAIVGVALRLQHKGKHLVTTPVEHHAVLHAMEWLRRTLGFEITYLDVDEYGRADPEALAAVLRPDTTLVSVMLANNEVGTIQPVREMARVCRERGVLLHTDAVQAAGALDLRVDELQVDLLSISGHKFYGPKGVGALYVRRGTPVLPLIQGGGQERGLRSGTENVAGIVGLATALELAYRQFESRVAHARRLRDRLVDGVLGTIERSRLTGHPTQRLPNSASFAFEGADGESILLNLDQRGICASSGSACASGSLEMSHVLRALRLPDSFGMGSLRLTTGLCNGDEDVDAVLECLPEIVRRVRELAPVATG
jgi:cysteine desulfurase